MIPLLPGFRPDGTPDPGVADRVARAWLSGGLVGLPTETVYGLAADAQDRAAVARLYQAKGRPSGHPLIVHVQGPQALDGWTDSGQETARQLVERFWPGPLTVVVRRSSRAGDFITGGQDTVALRCPAHPVARRCIAALAAASGDPARGVAAPSANRFGRVSPTRAQDVLAELGSRLDPRLDLVVDGGAAAVGVESTIVDCTVARPDVLRLGAISQAQVDAVLFPDEGPATGDDVDRVAMLGRAGATAPDGGASRSGPPAGGAPGGPGTVPVRAPGTLESHYAPAAHVLTVEADELLDVEATMARGRRVGIIADAATGTPHGWLRLAAPRGADEYAHQLYAALRRADAEGVDEVVAVLPPRGSGPLAAAVRDRLARAAHERPASPPLGHGPRPPST